MQGRGRQRVVPVNKVVLCAKDPDRPCRYVCQADLESEEHTGTRCATKPMAIGAGASLRVEEGAGCLLVCAGTVDLARVPCLHTGPRVSVPPAGRWCEVAAGDFVTGRE